MNDLVIRPSSQPHGFLQERDMHKETEADCDPFRFLVNFLAFQYLAIQVVSCFDGSSQSGSCVHSWVTSGCSLHFPVGDLYKLFCKHKDDLISCR